jgi:seryl-tRNA synthetase
MLDLKFIRENPDLVKQGAAKKRMKVDVDRLLQLDASRRAVQTKLQDLTTEQNKASKEMGPLMGQLKKEQDPAKKAELEKKIESLKARPAAIKQEMATLEEQMKTFDPEIRELLLTIPAPADTDVPDGKDDTENVEIKKVGTVRQFDFAPKDHITLGKELNMIDVERGVKLAGARSYFLLGAGTLLHQAVLRLAQDMMIDRGFVPMSVPVLVRHEPMEGTGYFPLGREQAYAMSNEDPPKFLVGTAEVSLTAYHMDETLDAKSLPKKYVAQSPCFRREAGTYGKDTAGLYRIHQFDKVEQVVICKNDIEESKRWHQAILQNAEDVLTALELPYRVVFVCSGDLGQGQAAKYDIETWMPSRNAYGETHSASRFYDFQARRLNLRYRDEDGKVKFCHTLNNTVIASPRILIPLMENHQNADGSINVPKALQKYMNGQDRITAK